MLAALGEHARASHAHTPAPIPHPLAHPGMPDEPKKRPAPAGLNRG
jgi:hypothetical protein